MADNRRMSRFNKVDTTGEVDYKQLDVLKNYLTEAGKIVPGRVTGASVYQQRRVARSVKQARFLALIPYTDKH